MNKKVTINTKSKIKNKGNQYLPQEVNETLIQSYELKSEIVNTINENLFILNYLMHPLIVGHKQLN